MLALNAMILHQVNEEVAVLVFITPQSGRRCSARIAGQPVSVRYNFLEHENFHRLHPQQTITNNCGAHALSDKKLRSTIDTYLADVRSPLSRRGDSYVAPLGDAPSHQPSSQGPSPERPQREGTFCSFPGCLRPKQPIGKCDTCSYKCHADCEYAAGVTRGKNQMLCGPCGDAAATKLKKKQIMASEKAAKTAASAASAALATARAASAASAASAVKARAAASEKQNREEQPPVRESFPAASADRPSSGPRVSAPAEDGVSYKAFTHMTQSLLQMNQQGNNALQIVAGMGGLQTPNPKRSAGEHEEKETLSQKRTKLDEADRQLRLEEADEKARMRRILQQAAADANEAMRAFMEDP